MRPAQILIAIVLALAACGTDAPDIAEGEEQAIEAPIPTGHQSPVVVEARVEDGVQIVEIESGQSGFQPTSVSLQANIPARLVFTRTTEQTCATEVKVPAFDIGPMDLPLIEPVAIEFIPSDTGEFRFVCGMNMLEGALLVHS